MSLLRDLQNAAASDDVPVATLLRKARILAARLAYTPLERWVARELDGYGSKDELPDYRRLRHLDVKANFSGPFGSAMQNANVPPACIDAAYRDMLFSADNRQGIAAVDDLLRSDSGSFSVPWPADAVVRYAESVYEDMAMMDARKIIPRGSVVGIADGVRNRLLSFALELEQIAPEAGEPDAVAANPPASQVTQIFNNTIYGGQAVIAGQTVEGTTLSMGMPVSWHALRVRLSELGVPEEDLGELAEAITHDDGVGVETQSWLGRLAQKAGSRAITLTTGVTTEVIALEIAKALGAA